MSIQYDTKIGVTEPMLVIDRRTEKRKNVNIKGQIFAAISASLTAMAAGTSLSWTSSCLDHFQSVNTTAPFDISLEQGSWVGSLLAIGALVSAVPSGMAVDKWGRKKCILTLSLPFTIGWVLIIKSINIWWMYLGRFLAGTGIGGTCTLVPMYLAEITEEVTRGPICSLFPFAFSIGVLSTYVVDVWADYNLLCWILAIVPVVFGVSFMFMPESPIYLVKKGEDELARDSLKYLRGSFYDVNSELLEMKKEANVSVGQKATILEILRDNIYLKSLIACLLLFVFQQFSGINAVIFYTVPIFKAAQSSLDPLLSSIIVTSIQVFVTIGLMFVVDKFGRRTYLIISGILMAISLFLLGLYFQLKLLDISFPLLDTIPIASLVLYMFCFSFGFGPIPWIIVGEINTPEIIGTVSGIAMVANWTCGFIVTKSFAPMVETLGSDWTFYIYSFYNILGTILVYFFVPETRFKLPHEIFAKKG